MRYSIVGLGKLGASMAAAIARRGFSVIGVDVNEKAVAAINEGRPPVEETGLAETIDRHQSRLKATVSHREAVHSSDVTFVVVPTPSNPEGDFSLTYAREAFRKIGEALAEKDGYHLVVMSSTVLPGATRYGLLPVLEKASGKKAGTDFGLCYSPEFIALGNVIEDFLNPDFTLVGEYDNRSGELLEAAYRAIMENQAPCRRMSFENAELTKISVNTFVTTKIAFANMLAEVCDRLPGGDVDVVTGAMGLDERIGSKYLKGGMGYGGPCFPRDNVALGFMARSLGIEAAIAVTTDRTNRDFPDRINQRLASIIQPETSICVLGLAYKPFTPVVDESQSVGLANALAGRGNRVTVFDPLANETARLYLDRTIRIAPTLENAVCGAEVVVVTTTDPAFRSLPGLMAGSSERPVIVIDFWRQYKYALLARPDVRYFGFGLGEASEQVENLLQDLWNSRARGDGAPTPEPIPIEIRHR